ncbi:hypothetical protein HC766_05200 [Candidatus Gracilibacteria bacterium]|nr:hypothetical protein [Candidatus Gracilibacteria bacterium]NJS41707.1 hypothetical protein [Candidatus Gracilibacteria bacterium]
MNSFFDTKSFFKKIILVSVVVGGFLALFIPIGVVSQSDNPPVESPCEVLGGCVEGIDRFNTDGSGGVVAFILNIARILTFISAAIAVLFIVIGGFKAITSAGDSTKYANGLSTVKYALFGLILAIVAYTIVALIGGFVGNLDISNNRS